MPIPEMDRVRTNLGEDRFEGCSAVIYQSEMLYTSAQILIAHTNQKRKHDHRNKHPIFNSRQKMRASVLGDDQIN